MMKQLPFFRNYMAQRCVQQASQVVMYSHIYARGGFTTYTPSGLTGFAKTLGTIEKLRVMS